MSVIRIEKTKDYTVMSNFHLRDKNLSLKAKGLMSFMLSLPDDWNYSVEGLVSVCKEGREAIQSSLKELEENKYLVRTLIHNNQGKFEYDYDLYEQPQTEQPQTEKPLTVNRTQLNTNKQITNELNTEYNNKYIYIVDFLNEKADTKYKSTTPKTKTLIKARLSEGFDVKDFEQVINNMCAEWKGTDMEKYLRPETLFGTKFESYLNRKQKVGKSGYTREELEEIDRRCGVYVC